MPRFNALTNTQLVALCSNQTLQDCYDNYVLEKQTACDSTYNTAIESIAAKNQKCEERKAHHEDCKFFADASIQLQKASKGFVKCDMTHPTHENHLKYCHGLKPEEKSKWRGQLDQRKRRVHECVDALKR